jgi:hypothetical protein
MQNHLKQYTNMTQRASIHVYQRGPFKQEYVPAANRISRQIRVQLHYFIFSFLGGTPIREIYEVSMHNAQNQLLQ